MKARPTLRSSCLIVAALLALLTAARAETEITEPKEGGLKADGPAGSKKSISTGQKSGRPQIKPDASRIVPLRIEFVAVGPENRVLNELKFDQPFVIRLVFLRLPGRDRLEVVLSQTKGGASMLLIAKRVKRTKVYETGTVRLTRGKRSVTRAEIRFPFHRLKGRLEAKGPGKKINWISTVSGPVPQDLRRRVRRKTDAATSQIERKYKREWKEHMKFLEVRWAMFLKSQKRFEERMRSAAGRCDRLRYLQAKAGSERSYKILSEKQRTARKGYEALLARSGARLKDKHAHLNRLRERWKDFTVRAKLTSSGEKLVNLAAKLTIELYDIGNGTELLRLKFRSTEVGESDLLAFRFRYPAFPNPCSPPPRRGIGPGPAAPSGSNKD